MFFVVLWYFNFVIVGFVGFVEYDMGLKVFYGVVVGMVGELVFVVVVIGWV